MDEPKAGDVWLDFDVVKEGEPRTRRVRVRSIESYEPHPGKPAKDAECTVLWFTGREKPITVMGSFDEVSERLHIDHDATGNLRQWSHLKDGKGGK